MDKNEGQQQQVGVIEAKIKMDMSSRSIIIEGPIHDTVLFLGMLEMAKLTVIEMRAAANKKDSPIEIAKGPLPLI